MFLSTYIYLIMYYLGLGGTNKIQNKKIQIQIPLISDHDHY